MQVQHIWNGNFPEKIFKYMRRKHADALCRDGELLLSGIESYPDRDEGRRFTGVDKLTYEDIHGGGPTAKTIQGNLARSINVAPSAHGSRIEGCTIVKRTGNFLVFCASTVLSAETMYACNPEYDSCVKISDVAAFAEHLTEVLSKLFMKPLYCIVGYCKYQKRGHSVRDVPRAEGYAIAFVKPPKCEIENEFRLLWTVQLPTGEKMPLNCPAITSICRLCDVPACR